MSLPPSRVQKQLPEAGRKAIVEEEEISPAFFSLMGMYDCRVVPLVIRYLSMDLGSLVLSGEFVNEIQNIGRRTLFFPQVSVSFSARQFLGDVVLVPSGTASIRGVIPSGEVFDFAVPFSVRGGIDRLWGVFSDAYSDGILKCDVRYTVTAFGFRKSTRVVASVPIVGTIRSY